MSKEITADIVVKYVRSSGERIFTGSNSCANQILPWTMVSHTKGNKLAEQYEDQVGPANVCAFGPDEHFPDHIWTTDSGNYLLGYAVFRNIETDECLVTMRDGRRAGGNSSAIVDHKIIAGNGRPPEEILTEARELWTAHLLHLMSFSPITDRDHVEAMHDAERIRKAVGDALSPGDGSAYRPNNKIFEFFPAFRRAYAGVGGFHRALNDIYGEQGNLRYLRDAGVQIGPHGSYVQGGELVVRYDVQGAHFTRLYEQMSDNDRQDFKQALYQFIFDTFSPAKAAFGQAADNGVVREIITGLGQIKQAVDHGTGAALAGNWLDLFANVDRDLSRATDVRSAAQAAGKGWEPHW